MLFTHVKDKVSIETFCHDHFAYLWRLNVKSIIFAIDKHYTVKPLCKMFKQVV